MHLLNHHPPLLPTPVFNAQLAEYLSLSNFEKKEKKNHAFNSIKKMNEMFCLILPQKFKSKKDTSLYLLSKLIRVHLFFFASDPFYWQNWAIFLSIFWVCFWDFSDLYPRLWISYCCCCNVCDAPKDYHQQCQNNPQSLIDNHQSKVIFSNIFTAAHKVFFYQKKKWVLHTSSSIRKVS